MKAITIRGIETVLLERLRQGAKERKTSINQFVLETLRQKLGLAQKKRYSATHSDLDHLFGKWSEEEYEEIQIKIDGERIIDEELWK